MGKHYLEANDSAGNTFKATAKPVLIGTAVVGATTMIFSIILLLGKAGMLQLSLTDAPVLLGFICGGAVIFWFCGASMQAVTTGAYRAVEYIKKNMDLTKTEADIEDSKTVVRICTQYAQKGMWNIFIALMTITLAFAFFDPNFFVAYLIVDRHVRPVPGDLHGQRRRRVGQRQEAGRSRLEREGHRPARRHRDRRHRGRSVQGHHLGGA